MSFRDRFPILERKAYLNSCSQGALSRDVVDAYGAYLADWEEKGAPWELWVERGEAVRAAFARLIGADSDEVAVTTSASAAVSSIASSLDFTGDRNKVIVTDFEFPTVGQIWHAQERRGAEVVHAAPAGGWIPPERFEALIDERTALVSLTHVCFRNGARLDVEAVVGIAHRHGVPVLLDSYQALGSMPIDVGGLGVDLLVGGTVKYLLGSAGLAFLYVRGGLIEELQPTTLGWFSQRDIFAMDVHRNDPSPTARRFEMGTPPIPNIYAGLAGIELVQSLGTDEIGRQIGELTASIKAEALERGFQVVTPLEPERHGAMIALRANDVHGLVGKLAADDILVSSRDDNVRIAPHAYNDAGDVSRLFASLDRHRNLLA
jgi:selenocysteine lyase/cysteine desulfurase